jgi:hypothetical protein
MGKHNGKARKGGEHVGSQLAAKHKKVGAADADPRFSPWPPGASRPPQHHRMPPAIPERGPDGAHEACVGSTAVGPFRSRCHFRSPRPLPQPKPCSPAS